MPLLLSSFGPLQLVQFGTDPDALRSMPPPAGALEALTRLSQDRHELVVVTSRQHVIQDVTLEWLDRHYSGLFQV